MEAAGPARRRPRLARRSMRVRPGLRGRWVSGAGTWTGWMR